MSGEFFVAGCDTAIVLDRVEATFDESAGFVAMPIIVARALSVRARRNDGFGALRKNPLDQGVGVIRLSAITAVASGA